MAKLRMLIFLSITALFKGIVQSDSQSITSSQIAAALQGAQVAPTGPSPSEIPVASPAARALAAFSAPNRKAVQIQQNANTFLGASAALGIRTKGEADRIAPAPPLGGYPFIPNPRCVATKLRCDTSDRFRTFDGRCNNLNHPEFGAASSPYLRVLDPAYEDGLGGPRARAANGATLPSAREVSTTVHETHSRPDSDHTHVLMQWGQFLDHDITLTPQSRGPNDAVLDCNACNSATALSPECLPIPIPRDDPFFIPTTCMHFIRSQAGQLSFGPRQQINQITSYIDASNVYGSDEETANQLRTKTGGLLRTESNGRMPKKDDSPACDPTGVAHGARCFDAGDIRNSVHIGLAAMHTLWIHQHNAIANELTKINPHWNDERLYQETRRIVGAQMQHITYKEFLPKIISPEFSLKYDLNPLSSGFYTGYDSGCDATIYNEFATAAYRFGHSLVDDFIKVMDESSRPSNWSLKGHFMNMEPLYNLDKEGMKSSQKILQGLMDQRCQKADRFVSSSVRNHLFGSGTRPDGLDLIAINIQRGRDHGLQPYVKYRQMFGLAVPASFADMDFMDKDTVDSLKEVYKSVNDIDLFTGLLSEPAVPGGLVGPLNSHMLAAQFHRLKDCDRFYYENGGQPGSFTLDQLNAIRSTTLAGILCENLEGRGEVKADAFNALNTSKLNCPRKISLNLDAWRESPSFRPAASAGASIVERTIAPRCLEPELSVIID